MASYFDVLFFTMHHSMVGRWIQIDHIAAKILFELGNVIGHGFFNKIGHHITTNGFGIIASIFDEVAFDTKRILQIHKA